MDDLFKRLQTLSTTESTHSPSSSSATQYKGAYREPSVSSPIYSPAPLGPQPHHASNVLSPNTSTMNTPQPEGSTTQPRSTDLLGLLKFSQTSTSSATLPSSSLNTTSLPHPLPLEASSYRSPPLQSPPLQSPPTFPAIANRLELRSTSTTSSASPQDFLLKLLNQTPKAAAGAPQVQPALLAPHSQNEPHPNTHTLPSDGSATAPKSPSSSNTKVIHTSIDAHRETVSEALIGVGEVVDKQVEEALAHATGKANGDSSPQQSNGEQHTSDHLVPSSEQELGADDRGNKLRHEPSRDLARVVENPSATAAHPMGTEDDWEEVAEKGATTFTLPMQPFKSIHITKLDEQPALIPQNMTMDIARVKRPFDQIDRNLVAATQNLMIYPLKNGGLRVIRQETGVHKEVFKQVPERIFNIGVSTRKKVSQQDIELVLGTGVEGTVFWAPLSGFAASDDASAGNNEDSQGFVFPPVPSGEENTSGGQLKTRVKPSARHPEYFAYGRGKSIYIVYPSIARASAYCNTQTRVCKSEKYLKEHMLRISTGKAGKDFIFSADDSLLISLDKAGRLKFWDIRNLIIDGYEGNHGATMPLEIKVPLMTLATSSATEKSWPTSIHLVDKEKPMSKGIALRYVIIGLKQNHTLQLWDLMLGKPVQEINFPHEQESDAICSVVFHPKTSILTVAHPTRNSIYFLHLSIPPYGLMPMSQSRFVSMVAEKDGSLPQPQSTIIVNGIREYKFSQSATIRSLDILTDPGTHYGDEIPAFVLYVMHSNGIMELKVDRPMLGLGENNRLVNGKSALELKDAIKVESIRPLPPPLAGDTGSVTSETASVVPISSLEEARKPARKSEQTSLNRNPKVQETESINDKQDKKRKKERKLQQSPEKGSNARPATLSSENIEHVTKTDLRNHQILPGKVAEPSDVETIDPKAIRNASPTVSTQDASTLLRSTNTIDTSVLEGLLRSEFDTLQGSLHQDRLNQDAVAALRQEAVLKAVSRTLTENVEDSLSRIVTEGLTKVTLSPLKDMVASSIDRQLSTTFNQAMKVGVPRELQTSLPVALGQILKDNDIMQAVAAEISRTVTQQVDAQFRTAIQNTISPTISRLAVDAVNQMTSEVKTRFNEQLASFMIQQQADNNTIVTLQSSIHGLQEAIKGLVQLQDKNQQEVLATLAQIKTAGVVSLPISTAVDTVKSPELLLSAVERERKEIEDAFARNNVEEATLKWMHSERKVELFDELVLSVDPHFLSSLSPLLVLSVAATVSENLGVHLRARLDWIEMCLVAMAAGDNVHELQDVLPNVLDVILQRIQQCYMQVSQVDFQDPILKHMHHVARTISDLKGATAA